MVNDFLTSAGNRDTGGLDTIHYWKKKMHYDNTCEFAAKNRDLVGLPCPDNIWKDKD